MCTQQFEPNLKYQPLSYSSTPLSKVVAFNMIYGSSRNHQIKGDNQKHTKAYIHSGILNDKLKLPS